MLYPGILALVLVNCYCIAEARDWQHHHHPEHQHESSWTMSPATRTTVVYRYLPVLSHYGQVLKGKEDKETLNKKRVLSFMQECFGDKDLGAIDKYIGEKYVQHNPSVADGREAFKTAAADWFAGAPKESLDIRRVAADDDMVWVHWKSMDGKDEQAVVDIFRLDDQGKIVEHWDVLQTVPKESMNDNTLFRK